MLVPREWAWLVVAVMRLQLIEENLRRIRVRLTLPPISSCNVCEVDKPHVM